LTLVPVLISILMKKNIREKHNPIVHHLMGFMLKGFAFTTKHKRTSLFLSIILIAIGLFSFKFLGSEFLPELNEGAIWLRVQLPYSVSLDKSVETSKQVRSILMTFPQVKYAVSQTGRPDDGTDVAGYYNNEFDILMYPEEDWKPMVTKEELIDQMHAKLA